MKIFNKFGILATLFPAGPAAADPGRRWSTAATRDPELRADVLRLGGLLETQAMSMGELTAPLDPLRLAYEAGRRDFAVQLATMMGLTYTDLNTLMETNQ